MSLTLFDFHTCAFMHGVTDSDGKFGLIGDDIADSGEKVCAVDAHQLAYLCVGVCGEGW